MTSLIWLRMEAPIVLVCSAPLTLEEELGPFAQTRKIPTYPQSSLRTAITLDQEALDQFSQTSPTLRPAESESRHFLSSVL